ncbi:MAG: hypothetical protein AVDCRST_MAG88-2089 [uncultured Thermomicrobiales bacterium]|uniref:Uncharacterized protein n=1 Tax=uncultured Thermomicrobiales bacterium TaxID=1645740 RepID=A0A6J4V4F7_9BACT|nr:MAG: hypothetical protein AVDCRST_MAG88-2089 [uncultured Thermomicrobiales bacterium]
MERGCDANLFARTARFHARYRPEYPSHCWTGFWSSLGLRRSLDRLARKSRAVQPQRRGRPTGSAWGQARRSLLLGTNEAN